MEAAASESRELQMSLTDWKKVFKVFSFFKKLSHQSEILKVFQDSERARWCLCGVFFFFLWQGEGSVKECFS